MFDRKFQIFVSSTYKDLIEARETVIKTILNMYHFPAGMEMFSADDDEQWELIQGIIDLSDYYVVLIGHRYGSETLDGISFTEKEYDYAKSKGIPIMAFVRERDVATKPNERDIEPEKQVKLSQFIKKATKNKMCAYWSTSEELANKVAISLYKAFDKHKRTGWVKADNAIIPEMSMEMVKLSEENRLLREENIDLRSSNLVRKPNLEVLINNGHQIEWKNRVSTSWLP